MKQLTLRLPLQTRFALIAVGITFALVTGMLGINILHQIQDVSLNTNLFKAFLDVTTDVLTNHFIWELVLNALLIFSVAIFCKNVIRQVKEYRNWNQYVDAYSDLKKSNLVITKFKLEKIRFIILDEPQMIAMTVGFFRPKIVLSSFVVEHFNEKELEAIIYHELYHYKSRHPLQLLLLNVLAECFAFLPVLKELVKHYEVWMELLADRYSIKRMGSDAPISHVLLAVIKSEKFESQNFSVHFANEAINYRLKQLIEPDHRLKIPLFNWKEMTISLFMLQIMLIIVVFSCM
ncbi:M56 family metallopeptidase [Paenibacillus typhae]|uniref:BlaR1 peptidase M56 n=1 Tax=Paenibacillus typhae TaxID=1174501 RepID=A0A1G8FAH0_9BACL|nr:M56 family metallopeptidase [Paenibacillus typhae]SDH78969.1 BlaR1 peptidase M56 [Paenibacillus typhae]